MSDSFIDDINRSSGYLSYGDKEPSCPNCGMNTDHQLLGQLNGIDRAYDLYACGSCSKIFSGYSGSINHILDITNDNAKAGEKFTFTAKKSVEQNSEIKDAINNLSNVFEDEISLLKSSIDELFCELRELKEEHNELKQKSLKSMWTSVCDFNLD